jgi:GntR family transcriptional regulator/MocR family aminotransferase
MRLRYRDRRHALATALAEQFPSAIVGGVAAGLYLPVALPAVDERALAAAGVGVHVVEGAPGDPGAVTWLALGYANLSERAIADGVQAIARACA